LPRIGALLCERDFTPIFPLQADHYSAALVCGSNRCDGRSCFRSFFGRAQSRRMVRHSSFLHGRHRHLELLFHMPHQDLADLHLETRMYSARSISREWRGTVSVVLSSMIGFFIQFVLFCGFLVYYALTGNGVQPNTTPCSSRCWFLVMAGLGLGFGVRRFGRDNSVPRPPVSVAFGTQLAMYGYPHRLSSLERPWHDASLGSGPTQLTSIVETFREGISGGWLIPAGPSSSTPPCSPWLCCWWGFSCSIALRRTFMGYGMKRPDRPLSRGRQQDLPSGHNQQRDSPRGLVRGWARIRGKPRSPYEDR